MVGNMDIKKNILILYRGYEENLSSELSGKEVETNKRICRYLDEYGIEYKSGYAVMVSGLLGGEKGKIVGIRQI